MVNDNLFLKNGYLNFNFFDAYIEKGINYIIIVGGRGTGKTFGSIDWSYTHDLPFVYSRKNQVQLDFIRSEEENPIQAVNRVMGYNLESINKGKTTKITEANKEVGFMVALSAISGIRGFDAYKYKVWIYDEFIHEEHEKPLKAEFEAYNNAYETINRNRELEGAPPIIAFLLANSNSLKSDILMGWGLVEILRKMRKKGQEIYVDKDRPFMIVDLVNSPISIKKKETALYRMNAGNEFSKMALGNEFAYDRTDKLKSMPLNEYIIDIQVADLFFYKHKSRHEYYISPHQRGTPKEVIDPTGEGKKRLQRRGERYYRAFVNDKIKFENMTTKIKFENYFKP